MTEPDGAARRPGLRTGRLEAFSDGVFAIAITLLVLDLSVPSGSGDDLLGAFIDQWPSYLAYIVSFATIGAAWFAHTSITEYVDRSDSVFARVNLLLLLAVSLLGFPTSLVAEYLSEEGAVRVAVTILGINLLLIATITSWLWRHAVRSSLVRPDVADDEVRILTRRLTPGLAGYLLLIGLGLFFPVLAVLGYLILSLLLLIPLRRHQPA
jgi:uncharacterized membrane protein